VRLAWSTPQPVQRWTVRPSDGRARNQVYTWSFQCSESSHPEALGFHEYGPVVEVHGRPRPPTPGGGGVVVPSSRLALLRRGSAPVAPRPAGRPHMHPDFGGGVDGAADAVGVADLERADRGPALDDRAAVAELDPVAAFADPEIRFVVDVGGVGAGV